MQLTLFFLWLHVMILSPTGEVIDHSMMTMEDPFPSEELCEQFLIDVIKEQEELLKDVDHIIQGTCKPGYRVRV